MQKTFQTLAAYDYRPTHQAATITENGAPTTLFDVDILGHIFEQLISDLERLRNELKLDRTARQSSASPFLFSCN